jgi:hypothetical protein
VSTTYALSDCFVLFLDAGHDKNGTPRRLYALGHSPTGNILAVAHEGYAGTTALLDLVRNFEVRKLEGASTLRALQAKASAAIRILPSYYTLLLKNEQRAKAETLVHGKPTLTL